MADEANSPGLLDRIYASHAYRVGALFGVIIALVTAPLALPPVQNTLFKKQMRLTVQVLRELPGFNVNHRFSEISVLYHGRDLTASKRALLVSQIKIQNSGDLSISGAVTSPDDPLGVKISGGQILGLLSAQASSTHLRRRAMPQIKGQEVRLPTDIIMDKGDYVQFDILILKPESSQIGYSPLGKIEGLKEISLNKSDEIIESPPFIYRVFGGNIAVQLVRSLFYFVIFILFIILLVGIFEQYDRINSKSKRKRRYRLSGKIRLIMSDCDHDLWALISNIYMAGGLAGLKAFESANEAPSDDADDIDRSYGKRAPPDWREKDSVSSYLRRALEPRIPLWYIGQYARDVAVVAGIDITTPNARLKLQELIKRFEHGLEEVSVDEGLNATALELEHVESVGYRGVMLEAEMSVAGGDVRRKGRADRSNEGGS